MNLSKEELVEMVFILGECNKNALLASKVYKSRYPDKRHPRKEAFERVMQRFVQTGSVKYSAPVRENAVITEENEERILLAVVEDPQISTRKLESYLDVNRQSVHRILKKNRYHPYSFQHHQMLLPNDYENRTRFCQWAISMLQQNSNFFKSVMWTDEATFHNNGHVNKHNSHYYADVNPHVIIEANRQNRWSLNVWGGILGERVIGPYFINGNLTAQKYLDFLNTEFQNILDELPLQLRRNMWMQQDGAPAHSTAQVSRWFDINFENKWLGRRGPVPWPARSPDLTPMDYFFWSTIKDSVYKVPPTTPGEMMNRITGAFRDISPRVLSKVHSSFKNRVRICFEKQGANFEQFL